MRSLKKLAVIAAAVFALSAAAAASATAAQFTAEESGLLSGHALTDQVFFTEVGTIECERAEAEGHVSAGSSASQEVTVEYGGCFGLGFAEAVISPGYIRIYS
jgi:hypothetical protein